MKTIYKREAIRDLQASVRYIDEVLKNTKAAHKLASDVLHSISLLADNPYMGSLLAEKFDVQSDLRYFIVRKHFVFYRLESNEIEIVRILDGRQDYMTLLFQ